MPVPLSRLAVLLVVVVLALAGCQPVMQEGSAQACAFDKLATLPVTLHNGLPVVEGSVNGHALRFLFDTGSTGTALFDGVPEKVGATTDWARIGMVTGVNGRTVRHQMTLDRLELGGQVIAPASVDVVQPAPNIAAIADGVLGGNTLRRFDVEFDLPQRTVTLYRWRDCPGGGPDWASRYVTLTPALDTRGRDVVVLSGRLDDRPVSVLLDSGASGMAVLRESAARAGVTEAALASDRKLQVGGVGPDAVSASAHRFDSFELSGIRFTAPLAAVVDDPVRAADVVLGFPLLRAARVWISYGSDRVYITRP
ncbi:MAG: aspartyl protease family protein [Acetobacteraceae bacterium]|nr:aspartyl protease family protein [Acetobacteraceae bacterium]